MCTFPGPDGEAKFWIEPQIELAPHQFGTAPHQFRTGSLQFGFERLHKILNSCLNRSSAESVK